MYKQVWCSCSVLTKQYNVTPRVLQMIHTGNIYVADDLIYIYVYCTCQHKINHYPWALQSVTADFYAYWLFNRFSRLAAPEAAHLELSGQRPTYSTLNYW